MRQGLMLSLLAVFVFPVTGRTAQSLPIEFGGQFRTRYEVSNIDRYPAAHTAPANDDDLWLRTRINAKGSPAEGVSIFVELQDSREAGSGASTPGSDGKNVDLLQSHATIKDLWGLPLSLQAGRFKMSYGDQRMISPLEWSNVSRAWDGARLHYGAKTEWVDFFLTNIGESSEFKRDIKFWGLYASCSRVSNHVFDVYLLGRDRKTDLAAATSMSERTLGVRGSGKFAGFDYSGEFASQAGRRSNLNLRAYGLAMTAGYTLDIPMKPRFSFEYDYASGDKNSIDGRDQTFQSPAPFGHAYQGHADVVGWRNLSTYVLGAEAEPLAGLKTFVRYHHFSLAQANDAWYHVDNTQTRGISSVGGMHIGDELDLYVKTNVREKVALWAGYSHFTPGAFVKSTGNGWAKNFAFVQATIDF